MPELPLFILLLGAVGLAAYLLRHEHRPIVRDDRPHPGVQNHEGDE